MIIVRLKGGLGNQMFQYALGRVLSLRHNTALGLDTSFYKLDLIPKRRYDLDLFNITGKVLSKNNIPFLYRISQKFRLVDKFIPNKGKEKFFHFDPNIFSLGSSLYLDGYWQSPKYFEGFEDAIREEFTFKNPLPLKINNLATDIENINSLCIHVRRGDYVGNANHDVFSMEYYKKGVDYINQQTKIDKIFVFSDDIEWCKNNLIFEMPVFFVGNEYAGLKDEGHMYLMSRCKNFIIANSSFSWWAAWLSVSKNKTVVCPKNWFKDASINTDDLIPKEWIRI
ncbi:MAG: alpha-1,2-fucosyltransferase [Patescibacteria group bacterium]